MPRILVTTAPVEPAGAVMLDERIISSDLESDHFAAQLIERISWALADADNVDRVPSDRH
jgi:hypothetical protein